MSHDMLQIHALGSLSVDGLATRRRLALVAGEKRLALFLYLLLHGRGGVIRRDLILPLLWPEADESHARSALRSLAREVRSAVGDGVVVNEGDHALGVDVTQVRCDVLEFEAACAGGEWERAVELYRGPLLEGFGVSGAAGFEEWLEGERARLAAQALDVCRALAAEARVRGAHDTAVRALRKALTISPYDERVVRELVEALVEAGDRAGALVAYEEFAAKLKAELEVDPGAETVAVAAGVRHSVPAVSSADAPIHASSDRRDHLRRVESSPEERHGVPDGIRPLIGARWRLALIVGGTIAVGVAALTFSRGATEAASPSVSQIAVFPFAVEGGSETDQLRQEIQLVLGQLLNGVGEVGTVDAHTLATRRAVDSSSDLSPEGAGRIAREAGAGRYLMGSAVVAGSQLTISATLYETMSRAHAVARESVRGDTRRYDELLAELAHRLLSNQPLGTSGRLATMTGVQTSSFAVLKAYAQGEALLRRGQFDSARAPLERSVGIDPTFATGWLRLWVARTFCKCPDVLKADAAIENAARLIDNLPPRDTSLTLALAAAHRGFGARSESLAVAGVSRFPDHADGWWTLGWLRSWWAWQLGRPTTYGLHELKKALMLDPDHVNAMHHYAWVAGSGGMHSSVDSLIRAATSRHLQVFEADWHGRLAILAVGSATKRDSILATYSTSSDLYLELGSGLARHTDSLAMARRVLELVVDTTWRAADVRLGAMIRLASVEFGRGRLVTAEEQLGKLAQWKPVHALAYQSLVAAMPFLRVPSTKIREIRDSLIRSNVRWDDPTLYSSWPESPFSWVWNFPSELRGRLKDYLLGLLSARLGDEIAARRHALALDGASGGADSIGLLHDLSIEIKALAAMEGGRDQEALRLLEQMRLDVGWAYFWFLSPIYSRPLGRFLRAEMLLSQGRLDEAAGWYEGFGFFPGADLEMICLAPAARGLGEIAERAGDLEAARKHYARFVERWRDADSVLQPLVVDARARIAELTSPRR